MAYIKMTLLVTSLILEGVLCAIRDKDHILKIHNDYRKKQGASNMAKLVWDSEMEKEATSWAANCVFKHKGMGENLAWNSNTDLPEKELVEKAMESFYNEKKTYRYGQYSCGSACHYTQLVWASTTKVGCATKICQPLTNGYKKAWYLVCRYDPAGNWMGQKPFKKGTACSACSGATCHDGLCVRGSRGGTTGRSRGGTAGRSRSGTAGSCKDNNRNCAGWAKIGYCARKSGYMHLNCKKSCHKCPQGNNSNRGGSCKDNHKSCSYWARYGQCRKNPRYMLVNCKKSCKRC